MPDPEIRLDYSKEIEPPEGFVVVNNEIDFLKHDGTARLWVQGTLCDYVRSIYRARHVEIQEEVSPRTRLRGLIGHEVDKLDLSLVSQFIEILNREQVRSVADLLFYYTHDDSWTMTPSIEHAARFLLIEFDDKLRGLVDILRKKWLAEARPSFLGESYSKDLSKRRDFVFRWLLEDSVREKLGEFPILLPKQYGLDLSEAVGKLLRSTNGSAVSSFPRQTINKNFYSSAIVDYFSHNSMLLTSDTIARVSSLLSSSERALLERLLPPEALGPIASDCDVDKALDWAIRVYLPFRSQQLSKNACDEADSLASSFSDWLLQNYPKLVTTDRSESPINLRTYYKVKSLAETYWVLWVVVDGLNFMNHQELLRLLGERSTNLRVSENDPLLAVLPTITEKAKFGLTTGKFPQENSKMEWDVKSNFLRNFPDGVYAGNSGMQTLVDGLNRESPTVCYWNYTKIDKCFHEHKNLTFLLDDVRNQLRSLADQINRIVSLAKDMDRVAVVICSDHGQMVSKCRQLDLDLGDRYVHGRTALESNSDTYPHPNAAFVTSNNGDTAYLNPTSFRLSEPTTVALGATYFVDLKATEEDGAIGVHGGLFPEEVIVGLGVLMRNPVYRPLLVTLSGSGESGKPGLVTIEIDNPNLFTVNPLMLNVPGIDFADQGELLVAKVAPQQMLTLGLPLTQFPSPHEERAFEVVGTLRYEFEDGQQEECPVNGALEITSLYNTRNPGLLDRFKK